MEKDTGYSVMSEAGKEDIDQLYHLLRKLSLHKRELNGSVDGIYNHLMHGPDYEGLLRFSGTYGTYYVLPTVLEILSDIGWNKFDRVYDLGAGYGWLGKGIASYTEAELVTVDKRKWPGTTLQLDFERETHITQIVSTLEVEKGNVLVCMCELLHCLINPMRLLNELMPFRLLVIEYLGNNREQFDSYREQIKRYGANADNVWDWFEYLKKNGGKTDSRALPFGIVLKEAK